MAINYYYKYAVIEDDGLCLQVEDCSNPLVMSNYIPITEPIEDYLMMYYNRADRKWYYDANFTNEWIPHT